MTRQSRRSLLRMAMRAGAVAGAAQILPSFARAASTVPLERAAVCIYLVGGNDSNSMIVPLDPTAYAGYASARGELAYPLPSLLPVNATSQRAGFGFHPNLPEVRDLYQEGSLAVLANTGQLNVPLTKAQVLANTGVPAGLFHHEQAGYVSYLPNATMMQPWAPQIQQVDPAEPATQFFQFGGVSVLSPKRLNIAGPAVNNATFLWVLRGVQLQTEFPKTTLGSQLYRIARLLKASSALGMARPIFSATMSGFDTHENQLERQGALFQELSQGMAAFYAATQEIGIAHQVVTYTQTEFNRTLRPNKTGGTEHGWGGHELIMGGSVKGGDIYGTFPSLELGGPDDAGRDGVWIPTTANQQYGATVAYWFGVGNGNLSSAVEGIQNFPNNNLGFLR